VWRKYVYAGKGNQPSNYAGHASSHTGLYATQPSSHTGLYATQPSSYASHTSSHTGLYATQAGGTSERAVQTTYTGLYAQATTLCATNATRPAGCTATIGHADPGQAQTSYAPGPASLATGAGLHSTQTSSAARTSVGSPNNRGATAAGPTVSDD
jgi:hypothetical protein